MCLKQQSVYQKLFGVLVLLFLSVSCGKETKKETATNTKQAPAKVEPTKVIPISKLETELLKKFIKQEIEDTTEGEPTINLKEYPYSVDFYVEGDSHTVYFSIIASDDFNDDGITDYIVDRTSEGMLGGNVNSNSEFIYVIMKDESNIAEQHSVLTYAPFSYNILDELEYKDGKIKIGATKNFRTYMTNEGETTDLVFEYQNGNLYEESYLSKCKLAELEDKVIFKPIAGVTKRSRSIEMHNYTETIEETYSLKDTIIHAGLSGCDNRLFEYRIIIPSTKSKNRNAAFVKQTLIAKLQFLAENTLFPEDIEPLVDYLAENEIKKNEFVVDENLYCHFYVDKDVTTTLSITVNVERRDNPYQIENWDITTRNKLPKEEGLEEGSEEEE
ncbi:hypothetical protein [Flavobacterium pedocola]